MSLLPQQKKSPEEIAKLRESLGIPAAAGQEGKPADVVEPPQVDSAAVETLVPTHHLAIMVSEPITSRLVTPMPAPAHQGPRPVHTLKRSERIPVLPVKEPATANVQVPAAPVPPPVQKTVRSLRKSEQAPIQVPAPAPAQPDSKLPSQRHSDHELNEFRRREALALLNPVANPKLAVAHFALLIPGYLLAVGGASCFLFYEFPMAATAGCAATALIIAAFIFLRRPISRHHAAFIALIALFVTIFGALRFFPQLSYGTFPHPSEEPSVTHKDL